VQYLWTDRNPDLAVAPELGLLAAVIAQALRDAQRGRGEVRQEALAFLQDEGALAYWSTLLGLDGVLGVYTECM
jgi:hypothetical protein